MSLSYLTAGESHGKALVGVLDGIPSGMDLSTNLIHDQLLRRKLGFGRGARQKIEDDQVEILSGVRYGKTLGTPISLLIYNRDWETWKDVMAVEPQKAPGSHHDRRGRDQPISIPRPGHADYIGGMKYGHSDLRSVLERASARETAMRVALGSVARQFLAELGISVGSHVVAIGSVRSTDPDSEVFEFGWNGRADSSLVRCLCPEATEKMVAEIERARVLGDTLGGVFEVRVTGLPLGLGSYSQWNRRIDGQLGQAFMSLNAIKGVEIGLGFQAAASFGSQVHDVYYDVYHDLSRDLHHDFSKGANDAARVSGTARVRYGSNRSGGLDGGMTSGEPLVIRAAMKPLATLMKPLQSVDLATGKAALAHIERSDVCAVPSAAVIGESLAALVLAQAVLEKFGGDQLAEVKARVLAWAEV